MFGLNRSWPNSSSVQNMSSNPNVDQSHFGFGDTGQLYHLVNDLFVFGPERLKSKNKFPSGDVILFV